MTEPYKRTVVIVAADLHIGSSIAICPPTIGLDDNGVYHASSEQLEFWLAWLDMWQMIVREYWDWRKLLILNGDLAELDVRRRSNQLMSANKATIKKAIRKVLEPAVAVADGIYVVRGTVAHVGKSSWIEEDIAQELYNSSGKIIPKSLDEDGDVGVASFYHLRFKTCEIRFDVAHHATMGSLPWTEKNAGNKIAKIIVDRYNERGQPLPHIAIRSHNHRKADSGHNFKVFAVSTPAWTGFSEYVYQIAHENDIADIGSIFFECEDGQFRYDEYAVVPRDEDIWLNEF